jgi:RNA polymerase sigma-70 factor (ECF subfamily)
MRASVRAWPYRIATNRSLDALRASRRRPEDLQRMSEMPEPTRYGEAIWLEPFPDVLLAGIPDDAPGPEARYESREAIALAFIVGLQHLPPPQRALVLRDVLGFRAGEVAEMLDTTDASVNSLLRRARAAFESRLPATGRERAPLPNSKRERDTVGRFADAIQTGDIASVVALLTEDAWLTMPPEPYQYQGPIAIGAFLRDRTLRRGAPLLVPTRANTQPAFGVYFPTPQTEIARPYALLVLTLEGQQISAITWSAATASSRASDCRGYCDRKGVLPSKTSLRLAAVLGAARTGAPLHADTGALRQPAPPGLRAPTNRPPSAHCGFAPG